MSERRAASGPVYTGSCLCGAVRYEAHGSPTWVNHCHCVQCQRQSGAAMVTWATWPTASVRVRAGAAADFESSPGIKRSFCTRCGGTLFWRRVARDELDIAAGTLDQADLLAPAEHLFVKSQRRWMPLCDGLPAYREYRPKS